MNTYIVLSSQSRILPIYYLVALIFAYMNFNILFYFLQRKNHFGDCVVRLADTLT